MLVLTSCKNKPNFQALNGFNSSQEKLSMKKLYWKLLTIVKNGISPCEQLKHYKNSFMVHHDKKTMKKLYCKMLATA